MNGHYYDNYKSHLINVKLFILFIVDNIAMESTKMGMQINIEKTEVQHVGQIEKELNINIKKQNLNQVKETLYAWVETHVVMLRPSRMLKEG